MGQSGETEASLSAKRRAKLIDPYRIVSGEGFRLKHCPTSPVIPDFIDKSEADRLLRDGVRRLAALQELLYANARWSLLIVLQAMDAAGKDGTIKHVMSGVNPQGVRVTSFKAPSHEELAHDFLWRAARALPPRGLIGIFNRSYYEEGLVTRVHPELLQAQNLPPGATEHERFWDRRLQDVSAFERHLSREGTKVIKIFLNVGRDEQKKRFLDRLAEPDKAWKFDAGDLRERAFWPDYMAAYEAAIAATATEKAPWFVVPADEKWFMRLVVVETVCEALEQLRLAPVEPSPEQVKAFAAARAALEAESN